MTDIRERTAAAAARGCALLLCVLLAPAWISRGGRRCLLRLLDIARGDLAFVGPASGGVASTPKPGLVSPSRLRQRMGISHVEGPISDETFFARASLGARCGLVLRYAWAVLVSRAGSDGGRETQLFGVRIDALSMSDAVDAIVAACNSAAKGPMKHVAFVNPDCLNKAVVDRDYHHTLNSADLVLPDGSGLRIAARLLGLPLVDNVNGTDLFPLLCRRAAANGKKLFFFGGAPGVALDAAERMKQAVPGLDIAGCLDGFSHRNDPYAVVKAINASGADIVLAGLGAPRQERWLQSHRHGIDAAVGIGVGGLFDYYSGRIARAPLWLRELGLEWVWRILEEPRAKWRRYVIGNPLFLLRVVRERRIRSRIDPRGLQGDSLPTPREWFERYATVASASVRSPSWSHRLWRWSLVVRAAAKRALDMTVAGSAFVALSPLLLGTAALIRLESPGPVLFRQVRVGRRGALFPMLKFRSMYVDAEARLASLESRNESAGGVLFKMKDDPRITRVGKVIRRYSIDELPQLLNVLRGEMSIVGPRPALPSEVEQYAAADRKRLQAKPGLTCLWQIGGRSDLSFEQQVSLDIDYLKRQNVITDLGIIARTVPAVVNGKGAY